jgi:hypothetical protein
MLVPLLNHTNDTAKSTSPISTKKPTLISVRDLSIADKVATG